MEFILYYLTHLVAVSQQLKKHVAIHSVFLESQLMVVHYPLVAFHTAGGCPSCAHSHKVQRQIFSLYSMYENQPQQTLKVRRHFISQVESPILFIHTPLAVETWMSRHKPKPHPPSMERLRRVVAHAFLQVAVIHKVDVSIHKIYTVIVECRC